MQDRVAHDCFIFVSTKNNAQGGIVVLASFEVIEQAHIHIHLPDILMRKLLCFQVDQNETLEQVVIEDQINVEMGCFRTDTKLASDKGESLAQFQQELLQPIDDRGFQGLLMGVGVNK